MAIVSLKAVRASFYIVTFRTLIKKSGRSLGINSTTRIDQGIERLRAALAELLTEMLSACGHRQVAYVYLYLLVASLFLVALIDLKLGCEAIQKKERGMQLRWWSWRRALRRVTSEKVRCLLYLVKVVSDGHCVRQCVERVNRDRVQLNRRSDQGLVKDRRDNSGLLLFALHRLITFVQRRNCLYSKIIQILDRFLRFG